MNKINIEVENESDLDENQVGEESGDRSGRNEILTNRSPAISATTKFVSTPARLPEGDFPKSPIQVIEDIEKSLPKLTQVLFKHSVGRLRQEEAKKIAKAYYEAQRDAITQKVTLALDAEKKRTFVEHMRSTTNLQTELQQLDTAARLSLEQSLLEVNVQIYKAHNRNDQVLDNLVNTGVLAHEQAENERKKNRELSEKNLKASMGTMEAMFDNHVKLLEHTLKMFLDDLTSKGKL